SVDSSINVFEEFNKAEKVSADQLIVNMYSQINGVANWSNKFASLAAKGFDEGIIQKLAEMGTESEKYIDGMLDMSEDYVKVYNLLFTESQKIADSAIDKIKISSLAYIDAGGPKDQPRIIQTVEYSTCFMKFVDPMSYGFLTVFAFSFVKVKMTQVDIKQISEGGKNVDAGTYVYEFDYNSASGAKGA
ncbi:MAG: hypothetical protein Q4E61_01715, partial [Alphaproteobacteria bacterium]|nr:hypothetical protein [Alphaproteobacteria bacterium]